MNRFFNNIKTTEPVFLRNLIVHPIKSSGENGLNPVTIDDALKSKTGQFKELDSPDINKIVFDNTGASPVLMLDGEEITGAFQNRIMAVSNIVEAHSEENIPVVCVEEERWDEIGEFRTENCSYPQLRAILAKSLHNKKPDTQESIWNEITRKLTITRTKSATSSMHDIYDNLQDEISRYVEDFKSLNHSTIGFVGVAGNRILGCDFFKNSNIYLKFEKKLIKGYALDAIEHQKRGSSQPNVERFLTTILSSLQKRRIRKRDVHVKIKGPHFSGQALVYQDNILHLSAFPS